VGTQWVAKGKIGEALARNLLLPYFTIAEPVPDQGVDFVAEVKERSGDLPMFMMCFPPLAPVAAITLACLPGMKTPLARF
jgi:hypothetical protein